MFFLVSLISVHAYWFRLVSTSPTRKLINTNENIEGIFSSVNVWWILPTEILSRYIPRELQWEKIIKTKQKKTMMCHFYQRNFRQNLFRRKNYWWTVNTVYHVNYKRNHQRKILSIFSRELWNYSLPNCTVNYCFLQTKSQTDWKVVSVIWWFSEKFRLN